MRTIKRILGVFLFALTLVLVAPSVLPVNGNVYTVEAATKINKKKVTLIKGQTTTLKISGTKKKVKWSSSKKSIASVSSKGKVTAKKKGKATITAKIGKKKYTCKIIVQTPKISKSKVTMNAGDNEKISVNGTDQKITWKSSNKSVATVDSKGVIKAKSAGTTTITATVLKKKYSCVVTVKEPVKVYSFSLNSYFVDLKEGEKYKLGYKIYPEEAENTNVLWKSSNENIVKVDSAGNITAIAPGSALITAECGGYTEECSVTVDINFNSSEAISKLEVNSYRFEDGVVSIVKNNYKYPISLELDCIYYKGGRMIGKKTDEEYALEVGGKCALFCYNPYDSNYNDVSYDSYEININVDSVSNLVGNAGKVSCIGNYGADNVMVQVKNNGKDVEYTKIAIIFYKNGHVIGYESSYADVNVTGTSDIIQFDFPYDSEYETIIPDDFELFVNSSYKYSWQ